MSEENKTVQLKDEDLEKVSGGGLATSSGSTYQELGISPNLDYQIATNHPIIVTKLNWCNLPCNKEHSYCYQCAQYKGYASALSAYCAARSREYDPGNSDANYFGSVV